MEEQMHVTANPPPSHGKVRYVVDRLADQLRRNSAPPLDDLLVLSPDEPLADDCGRIRQYMTTGEHADWWKMASALRAKYSGFQVSPPKREEMKYGNPPTDDAPLRDFVRARISHAKALWSRDVEGNWTSLQFSDWLRLHVDGKTWMPPLWPDLPGWSAALQVLRVACDLPRFAPTGTWRLRPPPSLSLRRSMR
jgi:hypothetical protein